jgi:hypothetical protein
MVPRLLLCIEVAAVLSGRWAISVSVPEIRFFCKRNLTSSGLIGMTPPSTSSVMSETGVH